MHLCKKKIVQKQIIMALAIQDPKIVLNKYKLHPRKRNCVKKSKIGAKKEKENSKN